MYVSNQLKRNAIMIERLSDLMFRTANDVKCLSKHASMVQTQLEQIAKSQNDLLDEMNNNMNDHAIRLVTRGGRMTQEPLYPGGHPKELNKNLKELLLIHLVLLRRKRKRKIIGLCMLLVNLR